MINFGTIGTPPDDYIGNRVGDLVEREGETYIVRALIENPEHNCQLIVTASRFGDTGSIEMTFIGQRALLLTRGESDAWWIRGWKPPMERAS